MEMKVGYVYGPRPILHLVTCFFMRLFQLLFKWWNHNILIWLMRDIQKLNKLIGKRIWQIYFSQILENRQKRSVYESWEHLHYQIDILHILSKCILFYEVCSRYLCFRKRICLINRVLAWSVYLSLMAKKRKKSRLILMGLLIAFWFLTSSMIKNEKLGCEVY